MKPYLISKNVQLGKGSIIEPYCVLGLSTKGLEGDAVDTVIGENAHLRTHTVVYAGNRIGNHFVTGNKVNIRESNSIGDNVSVGTLTVIEHHVTIGDNVRIHSQVFIPEYSVLEESCWLGPNVVLTNARYPLSPNAKKELIGPIIGKNAKIGANTTILPGVKIAENSLIGAGSVVTKDIPAGVVAAGNPAKILKKISELPY